MSALLPLIQIVKFVSQKIDLGMEETYFSLLWVAVACRAHNIGSYIERSTEIELKYFFKSSETTKTSTLRYGMSLISQQSLQSWRPTSGGGGQRLSKSSHNILNTRVQFAGTGSWTATATQFSCASEDTSRWRGNWTYMLLHDPKKMTSKSPLYRLGKPFCLYTRNHQQMFQACNYASRLADTFRRSVGDVRQWWISQTEWRDAWAEYSESSGGWGTLCSSSSSRCTNENFQGWQSWSTFR